MLVLGGVVFIEYDITAWSSPDASIPTLLGDAGRTSLVGSWPEASKFK